MSSSCKPESTCPGCGRAFTCGMEAGWERCWCAELPVLEAPPAADMGCYCPACLEKMLAGEPLSPA